MDQLENGNRTIPSSAGVRTLPGLFLLCFCLILSTAPLTSCAKAENRAELAARMAAEEGRAEDDERIQELKAEIREVDADVEKTIASVRRKADYWRLLGIKYMDYRMWGEAMNAFDEALALNPDHAAMHYNRGLCAGQLSLSAPDQASADRLVRQAETSYRRSLELDERYTPAMYGLAVLLVFELGDAAGAVPLLEDYLSIERSDMQGRFLLARAYLELGRQESALDLYEEISRMAKDSSDAEKADDLYRRVLGGDYDL